MYVFEGWASRDERLTARLVGEVRGGTSVRGDDADADGCDALVIERRDGPPVTLDTEAGPGPAASGRDEGAGP